MTLAYNLHRFTLAAVILVLAASTLPAQDDMSFTVEVPTSTATLAPGGYIDLPMKVKNNTETKLRLSVVRTTNERPDNNWITAICYDDLCFIDTMSYPPPFELKPAQTRSVKVNVQAGMVPGTKCRVVMEVASLTGEVVQKEFEVTIAASSVDDPFGGDRTAAMVYPNPASSYTMIPVPPTATQAGDLTLQVFNVQGVLVADLSTMARQGAESVRFNLNGLPNGTYRYVLNAHGMTRSAAIVLIR